MEARDWSLRNETKSMVWAKRFVGNDGSDKEKSKTIEVVLAQMVVRCGCQNSEMVIGYRPMIKMTGQC